MARRPAPSDPSSPGLAPHVPRRPATHARPSHFTGLDRGAAAAAATRRRPSRTGGARRVAGLVRLAFVFSFIPLASACTRNIDIPASLQVTDVTTGWFDAGIVDGMNKLVPTVQFQLHNVSGSRISSVQVNSVFRRVGEEEEWGAALARGIGPDGLAPGEKTPPIVLRSQLGYTGQQPRADMLQNSEFKDARVQVFAKHGSQQWVKVYESPIKRQLLTR